MSTRTDSVVVTVTIDGKKSISELGKLESTAGDLKTQLKGLKKNTDEWVAANSKLDKVNTDIAKMREQMGLAGMTIGQLTRYQRDLNKELNNVTIGTDKYDELKGKLDQVKGKLAETKTGVKGIADEAKTGGGFVTSFFGNFVAGMAQQALSFIVDFGKQSYQAYQETKAANAQVEASLKSTGNAAGLYKKDIDALAETLQKKVKIDDDVIKQNAAVLLTFTNIKKGIFEEAMPAITDLAAKMDGDLKGATVQVGKALNDPIKGISALTKVGVSFTEQQKQVITTLVETGDVASAQKLILGELNKEFGGSAEAAAKAQGPIAGFKIQLGELQEAAGDMVQNGTDGIIESGTEVLETFTEIVQESEPLVEAFGYIWQSVKDLFGMLGTAAEAFTIFGGEGNTAGVIMKVIATGVMSLVDVFRVAGSTVRFLAGNFISLIETGKEVMNFFGADFQIDPAKSFSATWGKYGDEMKGVADRYVQVWTDSDKTVTDNNAVATEQRAEHERELTKKQQKELEKREKEQQKHFDALAKQWQDLQTKIDEIENQQLLNTLSKNNKEIQAINDKYNGIIAATMAKEKELVDSKVITQQEYDTTINNLRDLQKQEVDAKQAEHDLADATRRQTVQQQVDYELMSAHDREIEDTKRYFDSLIASAEKEGIDTSGLVAKKNSKIAEQNKSFREKDLWDEKRIQQEKGKAVASFANLAGATASFIEGMGAKHTAFAKVAAIAQIAIQTGTALATTIAGATAAATATGPAAPFVLAGYIASGIATVLGAFVQAKGALSQAPPVTPNTYPQAPTPTSDSPGAGGASPTVRKAFAKGGPTLGSVSGGGIVPNYQVASFGERGPEYVIPNWMMQDPQVANLVGILEQARLRGFAVGGSTAAAAPTTATQQQQISVQAKVGLEPLIIELKSIKEAINALNRELHAVITYQQILDAETEYNDTINEAQQ